MYTYLVCICRVAGRDRKFTSFCVSCPTPHRKHHISQVNKRILKATTILAALHLRLLKMSTKLEMLMGLRTSRKTRRERNKNQQINR